MILVTGGTGLVGSHLLYSLLLENEQVVALCRSTSDKEGVKKTFGYYAQNAQELFARIIWREADLLDVAALAEAFEGITQVYHCAALVSFYPAEAKKMLQQNPESTANVVNMCIDHSIKKLVYVSSVAALGRSDASGFITEKTDWIDSKHNSAYAKSKYKAELEVWRGQQEGVHVAMVNPGIIVGPGDWNTGSPALIKKIADGFNFYTLGTNGFVDVRDVVKIMLLLMASNKQAERYIVVSENLSYRKVFDFIAQGLDIKPPQKEAQPWQASVLWRVEALRSKLFGSKPLITKETAQSAMSTYYYDNSKVKEAFDFTFQPMEHSLKEITAFYVQDTKADS